MCSRLTQAVYSAICVKQHERRVAAVMRDVHNAMKGRIARKALRQGKDGEVIKSSAGHAEHT